MADLPTEKKETAKKDEAYQHLWDTDQSVPEYLTLLMGEQTQKNEDAELHEDSEEEEYEDLEHPDLDYEYVYPGAPPSATTPHGKTLMTPTIMTPTTLKSRKTHQKIPRKTLTNLVRTTMRTTPLRIGASYQHRRTRIRLYCLVHFRNDRCGVNLCDAGSVDHGHCSSLQTPESDK